MWWLLEKKRKGKTSQGYPSKDFLWYCLVCFFVKCPSFLSPVFSCLSVTPCKTLCFLKSDFFVAATWQGGIIRMLHTICILLQRTTITVLLANLVKSDLNHRSFSFCPVPCPCPALSLTSFHLLLALSFAFSFPLISQQLSPQLASLRVFPPGCLILLLDKSVWVTPHLPRPSSSS